MRLAIRGSVVGLLLALVGAGCGGGGDEAARQPRATTTPTSATPAPASAGGAPFGPGIGVADALEPGVDGPVLVNGFLVADPDGVRLCAALQESMPPGCGRPHLEVRSLPGEELDRLATSGAGATRWSDSQVQILGVVRDGRLVVEPGTRG